jgi:superfamily I DNA/RNA helicase
MWGIIDRLFGGAEEIYFAGDDDQAIFAFSMADARMFIERARRSTRIFLRQTHRFGGEIVELSKEIIRRVSDRVEKEVLGAQGREHLIQHTGSFQPFVDGDALILHRHVAGCQGLGALYRDAGLPYRNERGKDPLGSYARIQAYKALRGLAEGRLVSMGAAARLIEDLMPSTVIDENNQKMRLIVHGAKKKLQNSGSTDDVTVLDLVKMGVLTGDGADIIRQKFFTALKHSDDLEYYDRVVENGYDLEGKCPVITTIHGSKGREAGKVVVFSEMGSRCWDDSDTEYRLGYVAATRTKGIFEVCSESLLPWNKVSHFNYPVGHRKGNMTPVVTPEE